MLGLDLPVPDFSTLSRRAQSLELPAQPRAPGGAIHLLVDSSGLKLGGPGEWLVEKHGTSRRRSWRKLHIGFDAVTGRIVASILTDRDVDNASQVEPLLDRIAEPVELFLGDGGYDRTGGLHRPGPAPSGREGDHATHNLAKLPFDLSVTVERALLHPPCRDGLAGALLKLNRLPVGQVQIRGADGTAQNLSVGSCGPGELRDLPAE